MLIFFHDNSSRLQFQRKHTTHNTTEHQQQQKTNVKASKRINKQNAGWSENDGSW